VRISGYYEWTIGADGLITESRRHYDEAEYARRLEHGIGAAGKYLIWSKSLLRIPSEVSLACR
jgi:hypothetical protein